ncbi:cell division cycle protein Cdc20 [Morchella conica CCBAS932]|uniref:Cell division cycle protein Cdc20 n=1 Tax=Morchella conica CCBAS932 TaxID=1392247 RepID=A0A3N4KXJ9_9PEZI|nr:cell division cycle protein Cdc20 [Morchella conica CCBAS932]
MSVAAILTPVKSHGGIFNTRTAGGRVNLMKSSPLSRVTSNNAPPFTPPRARRHDPDWHAERKSSHNLQEACTSRDGGSLFASYQTPTKTRKNISASPTVRFAVSPKSNIAGAVASPQRMGVGASKWTLNPVNSSASKYIAKAEERFQLRNTRPKRTWDAPRDRFIPNRAASSGTALLKIHKVQTCLNKYSTNTKLNTEDGILEGRVFGRNHGQVNVKSPGIDFDQPNVEALQAQSSFANALGIDLESRVFEFRPKTKPKPFDMRAEYNRPLVSVASKEKRHIQSCPDRVLDAPGIKDDFYLNLVDWSSGNRVVVGLDQEVYTWNAATNQSSLLAQTHGDTYVSSVKFARDEETLAIGTSDGKVQIWDVEKQKRTRTIQCHAGRVGVMAWSSSGTFTTGSKSGSIWNHDLRMREHKTSELISHQLEVCGLEWRSDGLMLASGGNDNRVNIWDARVLNAPRFTKTNHKAAVKALAWSPWQLNTLATGGGQGDGKIHFWNSTTGARIKSIDSGSQVSSLKWSSSYHEIVSCHGAPDNQLTIWNYPDLTRKCEIPAHESRILFSALSPDGQTLATCADDENLKFWKIFENKPGKKQATKVKGRPDWMLNTVIR